MISSNRPFSGHDVRHSEIINLKKNVDAINILKNKILSLDLKCKENFRILCGQLVVGLRGRYSKSTNNINLFDTKPEILKNEIIFIEDRPINIVLTVVENILQFINKCFNIDDTKTLISLCTHRHTTLSSVCKYPKRLKRLFKEAGISTSLVDLKENHNKFSKIFDNQNHYSYLNKQ